MKLKKYVISVILLTAFVVFNMAPGTRTSSPKIRTSSGNTNKAGLSSMNPSSAVSCDSGYLYEDSTGSFAACVAPEDVPSALACPSRVIGGVRYWYPVTTLEYDFVRCRSNLELTTQAPSTVKLKPHAGPKHTRISKHDHHKKPHANRTGKPQSTRPFGKN